MSSLIRKVGFVSVLLCLSCSLAYAGIPAFTASFSPATVAASTESTLTYTIATDDEPLQGMEFSHYFSDFVFATPSGATSNCNGIVLLAADGGSTLTASNIRIGANTSCAISVNVKPLTVGDLSNSSSVLNTTAGAASAVSPSLTVDSNRAGYSLSFSPGSASLGEITRLTVNIDNTLNVSNAIFLEGTLNLPNQLALTSSPNVSSTCPKIGFFNKEIIAEPNSNSLSFSFVGVEAEATCSISVDVQAKELGEAIVLMTDLSANGNDPSGKASAALTVSAAFAVAIFDPIIAAPGTTANLTFTLTNRDRSNSLTGITFTDDLNATLSGLNATVLPATGFCGAGSTMVGSSTITVNGASLAPAASCTFSVSVSIPSNAAIGTYTNTTSAFTDDVDFNAAVTNKLFVSVAPLTLTMSFVDGSDPTIAVTEVTPGQDLGVRFILTNLDTENTASAIGFSLEINNLITGAIIKTLPSANSCGAGSTFTGFTELNTEITTLSVKDGNLAASASCTFDVVLTVPTDATSGNYSFVSSQVSATIAGSSVFGVVATDDIAVVGGPTLSFALTPAAKPGDEVIANFTLSTNANISNPGASAIGFSVDLDSILTGLTASALPADNSCGSGSTVTADSGILSLVGASLGVDKSCTFNVTLDVPADAVPDAYTFPTSLVSSIVSGLTVTGNATSSTLRVSGLTGSVSFVTNLVAPGGSSILRFSIDNAATALAATEMIFTLDLGGGLSSLAATSLPASPCGSDSNIVGTTSLTFYGGALTPGFSCTFDVPVLVPDDAAVGTYNIVSSAIAATVNGSDTSNFNFIDVLEVSTVEAPLITSVSTPATSLDSFIAVISFSEAIINFTEADITATNATVSNLTGSGANYTVDVSATAVGAITLQIPADSVNGAVNNIFNPASNLFSIDYILSVPVSNRAPTVAIADAIITNPNTGPVTFDVTYFDFDPTQINLTVADVNLVGAPTATVSVTNGTTSTPTITLSAIAGNGSLSINISANTATNVFGSSNASSNTMAFTVGTVLADLDGDGNPDITDPDDDGDRMTDTFETANGLNPRDANDAAGDLDGDGVNNLDEFLANSDPTRDDVAPAITVFNDITVDAVGLFTPVTIGNATAIDGLDGDLIPSVISISSNGAFPLAQEGNPTHFSPGIHVLTWWVADAAGNTAEATQTISVNPLVGFSISQATSEGSQVTFRVILNGDAVIYPVSIPYLVGGTAATDGSDHDLIDGTVIISTGTTEAIVSFTTVDDGAGEGQESIVVTMGAPVNAVNGPNRTHTVEVFEGNVAPTGSLEANQAAGSTTRTVVQTEGDVVVSSLVTDPNPLDIHSFDWSGTDNSLTDIDNMNNSFTFNPSGLSPGLYTLRVNISDGNGQDSADISLIVVASAPVLTTTDSDGDGTNDLIEGFRDSDGDGISDYLDAIEVRHILQEKAGQSDSYLIESEAGLTLSLGNIAFEKGAGQAEVSMEDIVTFDGRGDQASRYVYPSGLFDFIVSDLPVAGQSVSIVLAQLRAIPALGVYRKLTSAGWQDFVMDSNNMIASAIGEDGFCPPPGDAVYQSGLTEGHWCVQLTIEDGGPNDSDNAVNNSVVDPGGVAHMQVENVDVAVSSGSGSIPPLWLVLMGLIAALQLKSMTVKGRKS